MDVYPAAAVFPAFGGLPQSDLPAGRGIIPGSLVSGRMFGGSPSEEKTLVDNCAYLVLVSLSVFLIWWMRGDTAQYLLSGIGGWGEDAATACGRSEM